MMKDKSTKDNNGKGLKLKRLSAQFKALSIKDLMK